MVAPNNILRNVATYQRADLAWMLNEFVFINTANKKFKDFNKLTANLGDTVTFELTSRYITTAGLVISQQPTEQRFQTLTCTQAANVTASYTDQQFIFNVEEYIKEFGMAGIKELGTQIESDIALNIVSGVRVSDPQNPAFGQLQTNSGPYRFYGDGTTLINSYTQLAQAVANFNDYGAARDNLMGILPEVVIPAIVGTGLNQFAPKRNDEIAYKWMLGEFAGCEWMKSNLLPRHIAGTIGNAAAPNNVMTVVSTNDPTGQNVTQITFTEPTSSTVAGALKAGDLCQFNDGVSGFTNMRFLSFIGHKPTSQPVQFRIVADAATVSGTVTATIATSAGYGLVSAQTANQNINQAIQAGMKVTVLPTHRAGVIWSGNPFYLAMPKLPDQSPFMTVSEMDEDSGASIRHYFGTQFGQNVRSYVRDAIWGSTLVSENSMRLIFPD